MNPKTRVLMIVCVVVLLGCEERKYELVMTPRDGSVQRTVTVWRQDDKKVQPFPDDELQRLAKLYGAKPPARPTGQVSFTAVFKDRMPQDIGGAGRYFQLASSLGTSYGYTERFNGNDNLAPELIHMQQTADKIADHFIAWFRTELGSEPGFDKLQTFLDAQFRQDLKNMLLYGWIGQIASSLGAEKTEELWARAFQYLLERNYFDPADLPWLFENIQNEEDWMKIIAWLTARKMGLPNPDPQKLPPAFQFLANSKSMTQSMEKYLVTTPEYQALLAQWQKDLKTNKDAPKPQPMDVANPLLGEAIRSDPPATSSGSLTVQLCTSTQPIYTNGTFDAKTGRVAWSTATDTDKAALPPVLYAYWTQPNAEFQNKHFGKVILEKESLAEYCLWRNTLDARHAAEWETFLQTLRPGKDLVAQLTAFRFTDEPKSTTQPTTQPSKRAEPAVRMIQQALTPKPATQPATQPQPTVFP